MVVAGKQSRWAGGWSHLTKALFLVISRMLFTVYRRLYTLIYFVKQVLLFYFQN